MRSLAKTALSSILFVSLFVTTASMAGGPDRPLTPTLQPTPTPSPFDEFQGKPLTPIEDFFGRSSVAEMRITTKEIWANGGSINGVMMNEPDALVMARVAMGENQENANDRFYIMWNIRLRAELGYKNARNRGFDPPLDRWGPPTSIKQEALCWGGCQYAPVAATSNQFFPLSLKGNLRAMVYPLDETLADFWVTYQMAKRILGSPMCTFPVELRGFDGFRSPKVMGRGRTYYYGGMPSVQFAPQSNIWTDEQKEDNIYWSEHPQVCD